MGRCVGLLVIVGLVACTPLRPLDLDDLDAGTRDAGGRADAAPPVDAAPEVDSCVASGADVCNGVDDDCDATTADGSGDPAIGTACDGLDGDSCEEGTISGCVDGALVCDDDTDDTLEVCTGVSTPVPADEDCDGMIDEDGAVGSTAFYPDLDDDRYGDDAGVVMACSRPAVGVWVTRGGDCDDTDPLIRPGRFEQCNAVDDDCDGMRDEGTPCGDNCTTRERGPSVYQFCRVLDDWDGARTFCAMAGYHLVEIDDAMEQDFVLTSAMAIGVGSLFASGNAWIGLRQADAAAPFLWEDGTVPTYTAWGDGEPNGTGGCARMRVNMGGVWADQPCGNGGHYICEAP